MNVDTVKNVGKTVVQKVKEHPWRAAIASLPLVAAIVSAVLLIDDRYAHADVMDAKFVELETRNEAAEQDTKKILGYLSAQAYTRKTVLEMKQANRKIQPEELVELNNLNQQLQLIEH